LRPEQQQALDAWSTTRNGVVVMPTGTGKTEVALSIIAKRCLPTLVVAPVRDLMYQWHNDNAISCGRPSIKGLLLLGTERR
ncbi:MAG: DEAD/DEAH box helicase family protein, partial [Pirellula sp.]